MEAGARSRTFAVKKLSNQEDAMSHRKTYPLALALALALVLAILAAPSTAAIDPRIGYVEREPATAQPETPPTIIRQTIVAEDGFGWAEAGVGAGLALGAAALLGGSALALRRARRWTSQSAA
jgi:hypothetical protein